MTLAKVLREVGKPAVAQVVTNEKDEIRNASSTFVERFLALASTSSIPGWKDAIQNHCYCCLSDKKLFNACNNTLSLIATKFNHEYGCVTASRGLSERDYVSASYPSAHAEAPFLQAGFQLISGAVQLSPFNFPALPSHCMK